MAARTKQICWLRVTGKEFNRLAERLFHSSTCLLDACCCCIWIFPSLHLAVPLLRKHQRNDMSYADAKALLEDCVRVLFYRDCRALNAVREKAAR
jgi:hypothetical protein